MSDSFVLPGLRLRSFPAVPGVRFLCGGTPVSLRALLTASAAAAVIAGAVTYIENAYVPAKPGHMTAAKPAAERPLPPPATSTFAKTDDEVDQLAGLRSDPTLHLSLPSAWQPAGGLGILMAPSSAPNDRLAALPMPAPIVAASNQTPPATETAQAEDVPLPLPRANPSVVAAVPVRPKNPAPAVMATAPEATVESKPASGGFFGMLKRLFTPQDKQVPAAVLASNPHAAIYDISAHTVYMPNGETLEAHSGLGEWLDDPGSFNRKDRGVTPPATYKISLREKLFHGVQALRLTPVGDARMYGRDGMLAHTYMLGSNGQSNGCVSFKDYEKFLQAYTKGEVDHLIVVPRLTSTAFAQAS